LRDAELLRELQDRGRFFYQRFPGAAAAEEWKRIREQCAQHHNNADARQRPGDPATIKTG
jgi:hypothetical protein